MIYQNSILNNLLNNNFKIGDIVYVNGHIKTNNYCRGDQGINYIQDIIAFNKKGIIVDSCPPSMNAPTVYCVEFYDKTEGNYGIEIPADKLLKVSTDSFNPTDPFNPNIPFSPLSPLASSNKAAIQSIYSNTISNNLISPMSTGYYKDLNNDKKTIKTVIKYYYYKIIDKWLLKELSDLLAYIVISKETKKAHLIKDMKDYDIESIRNAPDSELEKRIEYIEDILITKKMVKRVLKKVIEKNDIKWYQLYSYEKEIKKTFYKYIKSKLEKAIGSINN